MSKTAREVIGEPLDYFDADELIAVLDAAGFVIVPKDKDKSPVKTVDDPRFHEPSYELGYREGESSADADWIEAFNEEWDLEVAGPGDAINKIKAIISDAKIETEI
jgi:hypothetical protein